MKNTGTFVLVFIGGMLLMILLTRYLPKAGSKANN